MFYNQYQVAVEKKSFVQSLVGVHKLHRSIKFANRTKTINNNNKLLRDKPNNLRHGSFNWYLPCLRFHELFC